MSGSPLNLDWLEILHMVHSLLVEVGQSKWLQLALIRHLVLVSQGRVVIPWLRSFHLFFPIWASFQVDFKVIVHRTVWAHRVAEVLGEHVVFHLRAELGVLGIFIKDAYTFTELR